MFSFLEVFKPQKTIPEFDEAPNEHLGGHLNSLFKRIKSLNSSRYFENIFTENGEQQEQVSCYVGNFRLLYSFQPGITTIDWSIWDESGNHYNEIGFFQKLNEQGDWFIISTRTNEELQERLCQVQRLIIAMETYESFMNHRRAEKGQGIQTTVNKNEGQGFEQSA